MARIAIIHISDDHTADDMVGSPLPPGARWVGHFVYPTKTEPTCTGGCSKRMVGWGRDKAGWMRCAGCGRRNPNVRQWLIKSLFDLLGANLYPDAPRAFRTPDGYGNDAG